MLRYDKLKIVSSIENITSVKTEHFKTIIENDTISSYMYQQTTPYLLYIEKDIKDNELIIEFTGKILGVKYPALINKQTIRNCLENINQLEICTLNIDAILSNSDVMKADVTIDSDCNEIPSLTKEIRSCVKSNERYLVRNINGNFVVEKNVKTKNRRLRLTIYDKELEMSLKENQDWLNSLCEENAANEIKKAFLHKARFELNLNSKKAIRDNLHIKDNSLQSVLNTEASPIWDFLDKVLEDNNECKVATSLRDEERLAHMRVHDYDLKAIEMIVRQSVKKPSEAMKHYRRLYNELQKMDSTSIKDKLRDLLLEVFIVGIFVLI